MKLYFWIFNNKKNWLIRNDRHRYFLVAYFWLVGNSSFEIHSRKFHVDLAADCVSHAVERDVAGVGLCRGGEVAQLVEHRTGTLPTQVRFPGAARDFSPRVNCQCRLSNGVRSSPYTIASIYMCEHVKDLVVNVRVRWIMETQKHPARTVGWVVRLCCSWLFQVKGNPNFLNEKTKCDNTVVKKVISKKKKKSKHPPKKQTKNKNKKEQPRSVVTIYFCTKFMKINLVG